MAEEGIPGPQTLERVPARVFTFLMGMAAVPRVDRALAEKGFDDDEHEYAWSRLALLSRRPRDTEHINEVVRSAVLELDGWDEPHFACIKKALVRTHPEQARFLFKQLRASQGPVAVLGIERLLDRLDQLEGGKDRPADVRAADRDAIELVTKRGYGPLERARLRRLVDAAKGGGAPPPPLLDREQIVIELYRWLDEWSTQARTVVKARSDLIRLGLAKRRTAGTAQAEDRTETEDETEADEGEQTEADEGEQTGLEDPKSPRTTPKAARRSRRP